MRACDVASVAIFFAAKITQVIDSIPWVRCASGNVTSMIGLPGAEKSCFKWDDTE